MVNLMIVDIKLFDSIILIRWTYCSLYVQLDPSHYYSLQRYHKKSHQEFHETLDVLQIQFHSSLSVIITSSSSIFQLRFVSSYHPISLMIHSGIIARYSPVTVSTSMDVIFPGIFLHSVKTCSRFYIAKKNFKSVSFLTTGGSTHNNC